MLKSIMVALQKTEKDDPEIVPSLKDARDLLESIAKNCLEPIETLKRFGSLYIFFGHIFPNDKSKDKWHAFTKTGAAIEELIPKLESVADSAKRSLEYLPKPKTGRPLDCRMLIFILFAYFTFKEAGGGSLVYWDDANGQYDGDLYRLIREMLKQIGYDYQSDIALGKRIERYLKPFTSIRTK